MTWLFTCLHKDIAEKEGEFWMTESSFDTDLIVYLHEGNTRKYWMTESRFDTDLIIYQSWRWILDDWIQV